MKGVYALVIQLNKATLANVGALGETQFEKGFYVYVGSAQNGLESRVRRHLRKEKRKFWHIDYLLDTQEAFVQMVFCKQRSRIEECRLANEIAKSGSPVLRFGCSDCNCNSHLFRFQEFESLMEILRNLNLEPLFKVQN